MKHIAILFALIISAFPLTTSLFAQDSTRISIPDSVRYASFDTNVIKGTSRLSNSSEVFSYNEYIWSDKRNLTEILELRNGFRGYNQGLGLFNYFQDYMFRNYLNTPIFRDGFDLSTNDGEIISINEIDSIELVSSISSYLYSNNYSTSAVNVISKDVIQPQAFSQLRYSQDRYNALYADVYFSQSFSKKFNLQFGLTKGSNDGRYTNSSYDKWQTRTKLNFFLNPNFNIRTSFYHNKIERGLFGGLLNDSANTVVNDTARQVLTNLYANAGMYFKLFRNKNNLTKVIFSYKNAETEPISSNNQYFHQYTYDVSLNQNIEFDISSSVRSNLIIDARTEFSKSNIHGHSKFLSGFLKYDVRFGSFDVSAFFKQSKIVLDYENHPEYLKLNYSSPGVEANYKLINSNSFQLNLFGGINYSGRTQDDNDHPLNFHNNEIGFDLLYDNLFTKFRFRRGLIINDIAEAEPGALYKNFRCESFNIRIKFNFYNFVFDLVDDYYLYAERNSNYFRGNIFYENKFFNNNLDLKTGFIIKHYHNLGFWDYRTNPLTEIITNLFNVDFYVGARIGSANVNFTLANLFNRFNYDTYLYPYDDRGGLGNVVSRFTIVWDFLN